MAEQAIAKPSTEASQDLPKIGDVERDQLTNMCKAFLMVKIPESNIISAGKFNKYVPLFNNEAISKMPEAEQKRLYGEYQREFSLQHPIKIYGRAVESAEHAEFEVVYVDSDKSYHEVLYTIPPMFRQLKTLNELGSKNAAGLINSFLNTAVKSDNPIAANEFERYGYVIGKCLEGLNPPDEKANEEFARAEKALVHAGEENGEPKNSQPSSDAMPDLFDW